MNGTIPTLLVLIPALPLAATIVTAVFGRVLKQMSHLPVIAALVASCVASLLLLAEVQRNVEADDAMIGWETTVELWNWARIEDAISTTSAAHAGPAAGSAALPAALPFTIDVTLRADPLSAIMLAMVTFVSSLVAIYAAGYMHGDRGYWRFFSYIGLFVFSMTMLVSVSNFVLLYVFWEAVGLCSYLLVGFWYEKPAAAAAGKKAFLVNRIGDFGFALGLFLIWTTY
ncbi:MAG: proton-conducting transporter membrane subunit, partial [Pirellulales bacterium]